MVLGLLAAMSLQAQSSEEPLFAVDLFKAIGKSDNLVFSPYSIRSCLGLAFMGAGGETEAELAKALRLGTTNKDEVADSFAKELEKLKKDDLMKTANTIYYNTNYGVSGDFSRWTMKSFDSKLMRLDDPKKSTSDVEGEINRWVSEKTNGKIQNLLSPGTIDESTAALLINAIYFKGEWESPFPNSNTRKMNFYSPSKDPKEVEFMYDDEYFNFGVLDDLDSTAVEMKYKNSDYSMVIVLPNQQDGLAKLVEKVQNNYNLMSVSDRLSSRKIDIYIPKFEVETELDLGAPLSEMGLKAMFSDRADFHHAFASPVDGSAPPVKITKAVHKAVIKVDEAGSEAAASTCKYMFFAYFFFFS